MNQWSAKLIFNPLASYVYFISMSFGSQILILKIGCGLAIKIK